MRCFNPGRENYSHGIVPKNRRPAGINSRGPSWLSEVVTPNRLVRLETSRFFTVPVSGSIVGTPVLSMTSSSRSYSFGGVRRLPLAPGHLLLDDATKSFRWASPLSPKISAPCRPTCSGTSDENKAGLMGIAERLGRSDFVCGHGRAFQTMEAGLWLVPVLKNAK